MKKFVLTSGVALLMAGFYVWGAKPSRYIGSTSQLNSYSHFANDTTPKKDTLPKKDSSRIYSELR